jgi:nucleoside-diphosphate-sugar epimerase
MSGTHDGSLSTFFKDKPIVVTGAAGFIGSRLVEWLGDAGCDVTRILRTEREPPASRKARIKDMIGDVRDRELWKEILGDADVVYHLAAQTSASVAEADPETDFQHNVLPMLHLLEGCRCERQKPSIILASTVTIYGMPDRVPVDETFPDRPPGFYDLHKKMAEDYLKHYVRRGWASGTALRLANVYGPGPLAREADRGVLNRMVAGAIGGEPLTIYGAGDVLRDYTYIDDVVRALLAAARHINKLNGQHFVIGSGQGHTVAQAIQLVAARASARTSREVKVVHVDPPASALSIDTRNFVADARRFREATGWKPLIPLVEGLDRTIEAAMAQVPGMW